MANNNAAHQPNDFGIAIKAETTLGSPIDDPTQLFTDSVSLPTFSPDQDLSAKSGKFVAAFDEIYSSSKNTPIEITASGLYNDTVGTLFEGALHGAAASDIIIPTPLPILSLVAIRETSAIGADTVSESVTDKDKG